MDCLLVRDLQEVGLALHGPTDMVSTVSLAGSLADADLAGPYLIKFGIESKWSCETTSTARFKHRIAQAFRDMRRVVEAGAGDIKAGAGETKARM